MGTVEDALPLRAAVDNNGEIPTLPNLPGGVADVEMAVEAASTETATKPAEPKEVEMQTPVESIAEKDAPPAAAETRVEVSEEEALRLAEEKQCGHQRTLLQDIVETVPGLMAAEVFFFDGSANGLLQRPNGGWYCRAAEEGGAFGAFRDCGDGKAAAGASFVGVLWSEAPSDSTVSWQTLKSMADNPEMPHDERTGMAAKAFGDVGVVSLPNGSGCLLVYSSHAATGSKYLAMKEVAAFLKLSAANFVTFNALGGARKKLAVTRSDREELVNERWATIVENLLDKNQTSVKELLQGALAQTMTKKGDNRGAIGDLIHKLMNNEWLQKYLKKCTGANSKVPPRADWTATAWTFFGVLITLLLMSSLNKFAVTKIGAEGEKPGEYFIMLGSFGALLTLLFGAPASPLCQPRNVIFGTTYSAFVAVCVRYLSAEEHLDVLPPWLAAALVPAIAIAGMAKLGVLHPPAGAASLIFIAGGKKVTELGFMYLVMPLLVGNIICTCMAILFNNLNSKRQYPLFW